MRANGAARIGFAKFRNRSSFILLGREWYSATARILRSPALQSSIHISSLSLSLWQYSTKWPTQTVRLGPSSLMCASSSSK